MTGSGKAFNHGPRLLLVDDDPVFLAIITSLLRSRLAHITVVPCDSAKKALECFAATPCSLVVTDMRMPMQNGLELVEEMKKQQPHTPVILMTGYAPEPLVGPATALGVFGIVAKPIEESVLLNMINRALMPPHNP